MGFFLQERRKAIAYYRHSAEDKQEYSVAIQQEQAREFAKRKNIDIIHEETDEGKTGLIADRPGFQNILRNWVTNPKAPAYDYILVFDVSRWGRFQDTDESGYYEYLARKSGKMVIYVPRGIPTEEQKLSYALQTTLERHMAAEYSAALSRKVFYGSVNVSKKGYSAGGLPPYGLGRLLLDEQRRPIQLLKRGERKMISNQRVTFKPLKDRSTHVVREIFSFFVHDNNSLHDIARILNERGIPSPGGRSWSTQTIRHILDNENYLGVKVYNKTWGRLRKPRRRNPRSEWVFCPNAFPALVSADDFQKAQRRLAQLIPQRRNRGRRLIRNVEKRILAELVKLLAERNGSLSDNQISRNDFPIIFGIHDTRDSVKYWYFEIPRQIETDSVVALGLAPELREPYEKMIEGVFCIPVRDFGPYFSMVFSERDACYSRYVNTIDRAKECALQAKQSTHL